MSAKLSYLSLVSYSLLTHRDRHRTSSPAIEETGCKLCTVKKIQPKALPTDLNTLLL